MAWPADSSALAPRVELEMFVLMAGLLRKWNGPSFMGGYPANCDFLEFKWLSADWEPKSSAERSQRWNILESYDLLILRLRI